MKHCINLKKIAFMEGDKRCINDLRKELRDKTRLAKLRYKDKMEERFTKQNTKAAWQNLNMMMGKAQASSRVQCPDPAFFAEQLNVFFNARFNIIHSGVNWDQTGLSNASKPISVDEKRVVSIISKLQPRKASGPDGLQSFLLKECLAQLGGMVAQLFQLSLNTGFVPRAWKETTIIPVPKKLYVKEMKNFRPVALTSMERKRAWRQRQPRVPGWGRQGRSRLCGLPWNEADSEADSGGSRNGAGSGADSVGSWNGAGSATNSTLKAEPFRCRARLR